MNIEEMESEVRSLEDSIVYDTAKLESAKAEQERFNRLSELSDEVRNCQVELGSYIQKVAILYNICNKKAEEFSNKRVALLEKTVEENLLYIFPEEQFRVKVDLDVSKTGRETCSLLLGKMCHNGEIKYAPTHAQNGRFVRQLISVVVVYTLNYIRGSDMIYLDEALASSDKVNLTKLKPLLERIRNSGMQTILIEHKPEFYQSVSRRQFQLLKDRIANKTDIVNADDIDIGDE